MLEIVLLGEQRVESDGVRLDGLRSPRTVQLLARLVLHAGAPQLRQHLAGLLWPDSPESQARTNLRRELHGLRAALPDPERFLVVDGTSVTWRSDAPSRSDVEAFCAAAAEADAAVDHGDDEAFRAAAERAVRAYGGELLPGHYEDWVLTERDRLHRRGVGLLDRLLAQLADGDEVDAAIAVARRRVELEPLEEAGYRALMELQARAGDRAAALRTFRRCVAVLQRELGVEPSSSTQGLHERLVAPGPASAPAPAPVPAPAPAPALASGTASASAPDPPGRGRTGRRSPGPLVGRAGELEVLRRAWKQAAQGPHIVVIAGEAGVGKTRLADELADLVEGLPATVARARCVGSQWRLPLGPVGQWLRAPAVWTGVERLDPTWRAEVARLVPELGEEEPAGRVPPSDEWQRRQFLEGLARGVLAGGPTLLVLDDLQWCDTETLTWLEVLLCLDAAAPLLVVATLRSEELEDSPELGDWRRHLRAQGLLQELDLGPLDPAHVAELAESLGGEALDDDAARRLHAETGGHPLFVIETLRQDTVSTPPRADAVLAGRLDQLTPTAAGVAELVAAVGHEASLEVLAAASDLDEETLVAALGELWRRRLLREGRSSGYDLAHDLLRDAAYARLAPPQRRLLHRRIAGALERLHADEPTAAAEIADHHERGDRPELAIGHHLAAAERATTLFAHADAIGHLERALGLLDGLGECDTARRGEVLLRLGRAQRHAGDHRHARTLSDAAHMAGRLGEFELLARAVLSDAERGFWTAPYAPDPERRELVCTALRRLPDAPSELRARLLGRLAIEVYLSPEYPDALALLDEAEAIARELHDPEVLLDVLASRAYAGQNPDTLPTMPEVGAEMVELAETIGDPLRLVHACLRLDQSLLKVGQSERAAEALERATVIGKDLDHPPTDFWLANDRTARALYEGDPGLAQQRLTEMVTLGRRAEVVDAERRGMYADYAARLLTGRLDELEPIVPGLMRIADAPLRLLQAGGALILLHAGRRDEARGVFERLVDHLDEVPFAVNWHTTLALLTWLARPLGDRERGNRLYERLRPYPGLVLHAGATVFGTTDHAIALAAAAAGRLDEADGCFAAAVTFQQHAGMHGWQMLSHLEWARTIVEYTDDPAAMTQAADLLARARSAAERVGNERVLADAGRLEAAALARV